MSDRSSDPLRVQLKPAFAFECPRCGAANYLRAEIVEATPAVADELHYDGEFLVAPARAECTACGAVVTPEEG